MLKLKIVFIFVLLLYKVNSSAQKKNITGKVVDLETHEALPYSNIRLAKTTISTISDNQGKFSLQFPDTLISKKLIVNQIGYTIDTLMLIPSKSEYLIELNRAEGKLNEVVVSGVSKATLIRENPIPIISISSKTIDQTNASNIIDNLAQHVPELTPVKTGPNVSKPFINGLGYNRVLTLYDGMRIESQQWGDEHGVPVDDYNIEKAEIIMGPASLMYGSDALAGVVSLFPPVPQNVDGQVHARILSEYQTNNGLIGNSVRLGYSDLHWLWAASASQRMAKNYENKVDGRVYNTGFSMQNAAAMIGYTSEKFNSRLNFTFYDNLQGIPDGSRDSATRQFTQQVAEIPFDNIKNRPVVSPQVLNSFSLSPLHQRIQDYRLYSTNHILLNNSDVNILLGIEQNIRREYDHPTQPDQAGLYVRLNTINYRIKYNLPTILSIEPSFGVSGMFQNNTNLEATDFPIPNYSLFDLGGYGFLKWKYKKWTVSGGIRYDIRKLSADNLYLKSDINSGFAHQVQGNDTSGATLQFAALNKSFNGLTSSLGTTFSLDDHISFKANIARGYRSPNITEIASNGLDPGAHIVYEGKRDAVPEFSLQEDLGIRAEYKNFSAGISVFNNMIENYIYEAQLTDAKGNPVVVVAGNKTFMYQQTNAQLYGFTASLDIHPKIWKGFDFNNCIISTYGYNRNPAYANAGIYGEYLPFMPPMRVLSAMSQEINILNSKIKKLTFRASMEYDASQDRYLALYQTETATPDYVLFNVSVSSEIKYFKSKTLYLQVQVNNLFDEAYQSNLNRLKYFEYYTASPNNKLGIYDMGRNICLKLIISI